MDDDAGEWFLTRDGRRSSGSAQARASGSNTAPASRSEAETRVWSDGNLVRPLVHGVPYFRRLHDELVALKRGDRVFFTDWRGDADERLLPGGPSIGDLLAGLARNGVEVRGLMWRSHGERISSPISGRSNALLGRQVNEAGGEVLLDQRVRPFGSHHQKFFVIRHRDDSSRDVAFVGGIDLSHSRRDDAHHDGDPQAVTMDSRYGKQPPWHDAALELRGPVIGDLMAVFTERWDDPQPLDHRNPYRMLLQRLADMPRHPKPLPEAVPAPPRAGPHSVQLLQTYGPKRPPFPFAPVGDRSLAQAFVKAFTRARRYIYIEDQYLWSREVVSAIARALVRNPELKLIVVLPRYPDSDGPLSGPPSRLGQQQAIAMLRRAAPGRVGFFDLENGTGTPIYIHAKVCVIDDRWLTCGSANVNRRSWTTDSELTCAVFDTSTSAPDAGQPDAGNDNAGGTHAGETDAGEPDVRIPNLARDLRIQLWAEHLGFDEDDPRLADPGGGLNLWKTSANDLDEWHNGGQRGARPTGQLRNHTCEPVSRLQQVWATPINRLVVDPDSRPRGIRGTSTF